MLTGTSLSLMLSTVPTGNDGFFSEMHLFHSKKKVQDREKKGYLSASCM